MIMTNYITFTQITFPLKTLTIRPSANGDVIQLDTECAQNFQCVNEETHDGYTTINLIGGLGAGDTRYDLYELDNHTTENGTIVQVNIFAYVNPINIINYWASTMIKTHGVEFTGARVDENPNEWTCVSAYYNVNPYTDKEWTWTEIDALQGGIKLFAQNSLHCVTQVYAVIYYKEITPVESHCTLVAPENVSTDHTQNIKEMNMWNGDRIVFGESRNRWSLLLKGQDWENSACDKILCLKQQGLSRTPITISGLNNINWDTEWMIKSLGWKLVGKEPLHYEWIVLLEKT